MKEQKITAICVSAKDYKDFDKIITLLYENGKINAKVKGVKRQTAKLKAVCQPFCYAEYLLVAKTDFFVVTNANVVSTNFELLNDYETYQYACLVLNVVNSLSYQIQNDELLYQITLASLNSLKLHINNLHTINMFLYNILKIAGYGLNIKKCDCGSDYINGAFFDTNLCNFVCQNCGYEQKQIVSNQCIKYFNFETENFNDELVLKEANDVLKTCFKKHFNLELHI